LISFEKVGTKYLSISLAVTKSDWSKIDPTSAVLNVYKIDPDAGTRAAISGSPFTMTKQESKTGWYGKILDVSALTAAQYECYVEATVDGIDTHWIDSFFKSDELADIIFLKDMIGGRWLIENNQMKLYKDDNVTLVRTFDLKDINGDPSMKDVYEREVVAP